MTDDEELEHLVLRLQQVMSDIALQHQEKELRKFTEMLIGCGTAAAEVRVTRDGPTVQFIDYSEMRDDH